MAVSVAEFRKHLAAYLARASQGESIEVTSRGEVVARLEPPNRASADAIAFRRAVASGEVYIVGDPEDLLEPIDVAWDALDGGFAP